MKASGQMILLFRGRRTFNITKVNPALLLILFSFHHYNSIGPLLLLLNYIVLTPVSLASLAYPHATPELVISRFTDKG